MTGIFCGNYWGYLVGEGDDDEGRDGRKPGPEIGFITRDGAGLATSILGRGWSVLHVLIQISMINLSLHPPGPYLARASMSPGSGASWNPPKRSLCQSPGRASSAPYLAQ
jgi:hypothetical protein